MSTNPPLRVLVVDYASDARAVPCGRMIVSALPDGAEIKLLRGTNDRPWAETALARASHVILSGSDIDRPRDEDWFDAACAEVRRVIEAGLPVLGICFGHQFIAQALGGADMVRRAPLPEYGIAPLVPTASAAADPLMAALPADNRRLYHLHMDEVVPERAPAALGLDLLATTERCPIAAYRLPGRPVWGIQAHPEITPGTMRDILARKLADAGGPGAPARDIDDHPSCWRPEVFDAFLAVSRS